MNLTLRQLTIFESVARNLSYTRAAKELHLSQPAVSMQVRQLEDVAGLPLFDKLGKKIYLSEAGNEMYHYAQVIGLQLREMDEVIEGLKGVQRGHLRISVATTANYFATRVLAAFSRRYEGMTFSLDVTNRSSLLDQLAANEADIVIMGQPPKELPLEAIPFMENPLVVIAPLSHPLAGEPGAIPLSRLETETFVVREKQSGTRIAMQRFFKEKGISLKAGMEMTSNEAIKQAVEAGLGLGLVSIHTLELELEVERLAVLNVEQFPLMRHWYMVHSLGKRLPPVVHAFHDFLFGQGGKAALVSPVAHPVARAAVSWPRE